MNWEIEKIKLDLIVNWKISRNESLFKNNFILKLNSEGNTFGGEIAPNIRYGETEDKILNDFKTLQTSHISQIDEIDNYKFCHSFRFALESAFLKRDAHIAQKSLVEYLGLEENKKVKTSFSIPIMELEKIASYMENIKRFEYIKLKINQENAFELTDIVLKNLLPTQTLRLDGNEAFLDVKECREFINNYKGERIEFIEQPMPASQFKDYLCLKEHSLFPLMADESIENIADFSELSKGFDYINVKLMKTGGIINAVKLLREAKKYGMKSMIGCMIETSLGIRDALYISSLADCFDLDGSLLIKEDPFNYISEKDGEIFY